ncbi:MAG: hypothetical protein Fur0037_19410 [Planctomycetota bacterium]
MAPPESVTSASSSSAPGTSATSIEQNRINRSPAAGAGPEPAKTAETRTGAALPPPPWLEHAGTTANAAAARIVQVR